MSDRHGSNLPSLPLIKSDSRDATFSFAFVYPGVCSAGLDARLKGRPSFTSMALNEKAICVVTD